jgi:CBS-domain-containing membrane protein
MDAGLAGLLGGVIGATVGAVGAIASAVITGNKGERLARLQIEAQLAQAELQARTSYTQQQAGTRREAHVNLLDHLDKTLSVLDLDPRSTSMVVDRDMAQQLTNELFAGFQAAKPLATTAMVVGPKDASSKSVSAVAQADRVVALWMLYLAGLLEGAPQEAEWDALKHKVGEARDAWRAYATAVRTDLAEERVLGDRR